MYNNILAVMKSLAVKDTRESGNLKNKLQEMDIAKIKMISDAYYHKKHDTREDIFERGLALGREIREKTVYRIEIVNDVYYFVGTESDILNKIDKVKE